MPSLYRDHGRMIWASVFLSQRDGFRCKIGDIISIRPHEDICGTGMKTGEEVIWVPLTTHLDVDVLTRLKSLWCEVEEETNTIIAKRRYCIPPHRLEALSNKVSGISRTRTAIREGTVNQPFLQMNHELIAYAKARPFSIHGLVFDKATRSYL